MDAFQKRLNLLEKSHCDTVEVQTRHEHWWKATQAKLDQFQARLLEDQRAREAYQVSVRDQLAKHKSESDDILAKMKERVDYVEILLGQSGDHNAKGFEVIKSAYTKLGSEVEVFRERLVAVEQGIADTKKEHSQSLAATHAELHGRLAEEQKTRLSHHSSMSAHQSSVAERVAQLERQLSEAASDQTRQLSAANIKIDQLHSHLHSRLDAHHNSLREHVAKEQGIRDSHAASTQERVDHIEHILGVSAEQGAKAGERPGVLKGHMPNDPGHISVVARFAALERALNDSVTTNAREVAESRSKLDLLGKRMSECELHVTAHGAAVDGLKKGHAALAISGEGHNARHGNIAESIRQLESSIAELMQKSVRDVDAMQSGIEKLSNELEVEIEARQVFQGQFGEHTQLFGKAEEAAARLRDRVGALARSLGEETAELHTRMEADVHRRGQLQQQVSDEMRARDALERAVQHHLAKEATARQAVEGAMKEVLSREQALRAGLQEIAAAQQSSGKTLQERLDSEKAEREAASQELKELIRAEADERARQSATQQEAMKKEQAARLTLEDLISQEKGERFRQSERILQQVQMMQREISGISPTRREAPGRLKLSSEPILSSQEDMASDAPAPPPQPQVSRFSSGRSNSQVSGALGGFSAAFDTRPGDSAFLRGDAREREDFGGGAAAATSEQRLGAEGYELARPSLDLAFPSRATRQALQASSM